MSFTINEGETVLDVAYFDKVDDDLALECQKALFEAENFETKDLMVSYAAVTDYQVTMPGLKRLTAMINTRYETRPPDPNRRFAYIVPEDVEYGMGRAFLAYIHADDNSRLFRTRGEALAWLGIDEADDLPSAR